MKVRDIMSTTPIVARESTPLGELARLMLEYRVGCVPIVDAQRALVGIVTEADFIGNEHNIPFSPFLLPRLVDEQMSDENVAWLRQCGQTSQAWEVMRSPAATATEDETVAHVVGRMVEDRMKRLPVVRSGKVVGVVARRDLLKVLAPGCGVRDWSLRWSLSHSGRS